MCDSYDKCVQLHQQIAAPMVTTLQQFLANPSAAAKAAASAKGQTDNIESAGVQAMSDALVRLACCIKFINIDVPSGKPHPSVKTLQLVRSDTHTTRTFDSHC